MTRDQPDDPYCPASFASRGVTVPFTTPLLAGARVRQSNRAGIELVIPNPSGRHGVCIVRCSGVREQCNPTVHDRVLLQAISDLDRIDPPAVRAVALDVALAGYAGPDAAAAAAAILDRDSADRLLTRCLLAATLIDQTEPTGRGVTMLSERTPDLERQAGFVLGRIASAFGCSAAHLASGLEALSAAFAPVGLIIGPHGHAARIPRLIARIADTQADLSRSLAPCPGSPLDPLRQWLGLSLETIIDLAEAALTQERAAAADPMALLKRWVENAYDGIALAFRSDWLLDGWERVCLLWQTAHSEASRRATLLEMAQVIPAMPREMTDWLPFHAASDSIHPGCRVVSHSDIWRSGGAALTLTARNEALRAMSI